MKVGIITFHSVLNYGAMLQAYALAEKISDMGHSCEIIDYKSDFFEKQYRPIQLKEIRHVRGFIKSLFMVRANMKFHNEVAYFCYNKMRITKKKYVRNNISSCVDDYDVIIVGSDQVWNMDVNGDDTTFLLDFVEDDNKRVSYAASISMKTLEKENRELIQKQLKHYRAISVRETDAKELVEEMTGKNVFVTLDPTLLLDRKKWMDFSSDNDAEDYILLYMMSVDHNLCKYATELSQRKGIPVKYVSLYEPRADGCEMIFAPSVVDWVNLYRNAKYVITNSFHGMAFSIIFHKQFVYGLSVDKGKNTRLSSLLNQIGIENRAVDYSDLGKIDNLIDYDSVEKRLTELRNASETYLHMVLNESGKEEK